MKRKIEDKLIELKLEKPELFYINGAEQFAKLAAIRYINPKTQVCSNTKSNRKGKFTTIGIYYVVEESNVYFLYQTRIRYSEESVPFEEIYSWAKENSLDMVSVLAPRDIFVVQVVAFTFMGSKPKPKQIKVS